MVALSRKASGRSTLDGVVSMKFTPQGVRGEDINAILMSSRFKQPFGKFSEDNQTRWHIA
jgi:hypothetical protein